MSRRWKALSVPAGAAVVALGGWQACRLMRAARTQPGARPAGSANPASSATCVNSRPRAVAALQRLEGTPREHGGIQVSNRKEA